MVIEFYQKTFSQCKNSSNSYYLSSLGPDKKEFLKKLKSQRLVLKVFIIIYSSDIIDNHFAYIEAEQFKKSPSKNSNIIIICLIMFTLVEGSTAPDKFWAGSWAPVSYHWLSYPVARLS